LRDFLLPKIQKILVVGVILVSALSHWIFKIYQNIAIWATRFIQGPISGHVHVGDMFFLSKHPSFSDERYLTWLFSLRYC